MSKLETLTQGSKKVLRAGYVHWWVGTFPGIWAWNATLCLNSLEVREGEEKVKLRPVGSWNLVGIDGLKEHVRAECAGERGGGTSETALQEFAVAAQGLEEAAGVSRSRNETDGSHWLRNTGVRFRK